MFLINATKMAAGYNLNLDKEGREVIVFVVKGTYLLPAAAGAPPTLGPEQAPLVMTDESSGEPGFSAPLVENDFAPRKPRCDVLMTGSAYAPGGRPADRVPVSIRVASMQKSFDVVGRRVWQAG